MPSSLLATNDLCVWLSAMPISTNNFDLSAKEFCDVLAIQYWKPLLSVPPWCDGCGSLSRFDHFLVCKKGSLIVQQHNEFRDAMGDLVALLWGYVKHKPILSEDLSDGAFITDMGIHDVWSPQSEALFNIR